MQHIVALVYAGTDRSLSFDEFFSLEFIPGLYQWSQELDVDFGYLISALQISGQNQGGGYNDDVELGGIQRTASAAAQLVDNNWLGSNLSPNLADRFGLLVTARGATQTNVGQTSAVAGFFNLIMIDPNNEVAQADLARQFSDKLPMNYYDVIRLLNVTDTVMDIEGEMSAYGIQYLQSHWSSEAWQGFQLMFPEIVAWSQELLTARRQLNAVKADFRSAVETYLNAHANSLNIFFSEDWQAAWNEIGMGETPYYPLLVRYSNLWFRAVTGGFSSDNRAQLFTQASEAVHQNLMDTWNQDARGQQQARQDLMADMAYDNPLFLNYLYTQATSEEERAAIQALYDAINEINHQASELAVTNMNLLGALEANGNDLNFALQGPLMVGVHGYLYQQATEGLGLTTVSPDQGPLVQYIALVNREIGNIETLANRSDYPEVTGVDLPYAPQDLMQRYVEFFSLIDQVGVIPFYGETRFQLFWRVMREVQLGLMYGTQRQFLGITQEAFQQLQNFYSRYIEYYNPETHSGFYNSSWRAFSVLRDFVYIDALGQPRPTIILPRGVYLDEVQVETMSAEGLVLLVPQDDGQVVRQAIPLVGSFEVVYQNEAGRMINVTVEVATLGVRETLDGIQESETFEAIDGYTNQEVMNQIDPAFLNTPMDQLPFNVNQFNYAYNTQLIFEYRDWIAEHYSISISVESTSAEANMTSSRFRIFIPYLLGLAERFTDLDVGAFVGSTVEELNDFLIERGLRDWVLPNLGTAMPAEVGSSVAHATVELYANSPLGWFEVARGLSYTQADYQRALEVIQEFETLWNYLEEVQHFDSSVQVINNDARGSGSYSMPGTGYVARSVIPRIQILVETPTPAVLNYLLSHEPPTQPVEVSLSIDPNTDSGFNLGRVMIDDLAGVYEHFQSSQLSWEAYTDFILANYNQIVPSGGYEVQQDWNVVTGCGPDITGTLCYGRVLFGSLDALLDPMFRFETNALSGVTNVIGRTGSVSNINGVDQLDITVRQSEYNGNSEGSLEIHCTLYNPTLAFAHADVTWDQRPWEVQFHEFQTWLMNINDFLVLNQGTDALSNQWQVYFNNTSETRLQLQLSSDAVASPNDLSYERRSDTGLTALLPDGSIFLVHLDLFPFFVINNVTINLQELDIP